MRLILYSAYITNRLEYIVDLIFRSLLGVDVQITNNKPEFVQAQIPKIEYGIEKIDKQSFLIPCHGLLFDTNIAPQNIKISEFKSLPIFFKINIPNANLPFDILAMSFYLVSRYEEYLPHQKDNHLRFPAFQSLAYQNNFLEQPLINQWAIELAQLLKEQNPQFKFTNPSYKFQASYDIDYAWKHMHKGFIRTYGGYMKDLLKFKFASANERFQVQLSNKKDPYDTYLYMDKLHRKFQVEAIYFFLVAKYSKLDPGHSVKQDAFLDLIKERDRAYKIGIHPSYASNKDKAILKKEKETLASIVQHEIRMSRQHFLKLDVPATYQCLLDIGIAEDYSMGYAACGGFRASIANPFKWFNLEKNEVTDLTVFPFQIMDVTLKNYLKLGPDAAVNYVNNLIKVTKSVGGNFSLIWHNSSLSDQGEWKAWRSAYEKIVSLAVK